LNSRKKAEASNRSPVLFDADWKGCFFRLAVRNLQALTLTARHEVLTLTLTMASKMDKFACL
jgi:hypothetical protein